jgi:MraZ protein
MVEMVDLFLGTYKYQRDERGRFNIPARMRKRQDGSVYVDFVATRGLNGCIVLFPEYSFHKYVANYTPLNISPEEEIAFYRLFLSKAVNLQIDNQGRISVPQELMSEATIDKDVQIIGVGSWIEVWNPQKYAEYESQQKLGYDDIAKHFFASLRRDRQHSSE